MKDKTTKRREAAERQARYDKMSLADKLTNTELRPGKSGKENRRLQAMMDDKH